MMEQQAQRATTPPLTVTDLLMLGRQSIQAKAQAERTKEAARLAEMRASLKSVLPDTGWAALGLDPLAVGQLGDHNLRAEWTTHINGVDVSLTLEMNSYGHVYLCGTELARAGRQSSQGGPAESEAAQLAALGRRLITEYNHVVKRMAEQRQRALQSFSQKVRSSYLGIDDLRTLAMEIEDSGDLLPVDKRQLIRRVAHALNAARRKRNAERRAWARKVADAGVIIGLAKEYATLAGEHDRLCRQWALDETQRLWRPFTLWTLRYAPMDGYVARCDYECELLSTVVVIDEPKAASGLRVRQVDRTTGAVTPLVIGAFLDAQPMEVTEPDIDEPMDYCRTYPAHWSNYCVNVPPMVEVEPKPAPAWEHGNFWDFVAARHPEPLAVEIDAWYCRNIEGVKRIAAMTPEQYVPGP